MNIAICDDEQLYADEIKKHVECYFTRREVPHKIYVFTDGQAAARSEVKFDIAFLVSGLDVGKAMRKNNPNIVFIVVTAFSKYLDDALDLKVLRFLEKPINSERLYAGIDRAIDPLNDTTVGFYLRDGDMDYKKILLCDIIMIETDRRRTKVYTDAEVFRTKPFFMMPHNSFIINMNKIVKFSRTEIELEGGKKHYIVSVAPKRQAETKRILMSYFESRR